MPYQLQIHQHRSDYASVQDVCGAQLPPHLVNLPAQSKSWALLVYWEGPMCCNAAKPHETARARFNSAPSFSRCQERPCCTELSVCPLPAPFNPENPGSTGVLQLRLRNSCIGLGHAVYNLSLLGLPLQTKQLMWHG